MVAEDHSDSKGSAKALYNVIRQRLTSTNNVANLLPLVYLVDSILKNVKGKYVEVVEADADTWIPVVYKQLPEPQRQKLHRVWTTWKDSQLFAPERLQAMGRCFGELQQPSNATTTAAATTAASSRLPTGLNALVGGITRAVRTSQTGGQSFRCVCACRMFRIARLTNSPLTGGTCSLGWLDG